MKVYLWKICLAARQLGGETKRNEKCRSNLMNCLSLFLYVEWNDEFVETTIHA